MTVNYGPRTAKFISKLVQLTQEGRLKWKSVAGTTGSPRFIAKLQGRELSISSEEPSTDRSFGMIGFGVPSRRIVLTIGPGEDAEATRLIDAAGAGDLYDSIFRIVGGLDKLFDDVLKE